MIDILNKILECAVNGLFTSLFILLLVKLGLLPMFIVLDSEDDPPEDDTND